MGTTDIPFSRQGIYVLWETCPKCGVSLPTRKIVDIFSEEGLSVIGGLGLRRILALCQKCASHSESRKEGASHGK